MLSPALVRVAAIDLGSVRVGLAVSDELGMLAHPRAYLDGRNARALFEALLALREGEAIERFLVGLPRDMSGEEGRAARRARRFAEQLEQRVGVPVELVDERLSTTEARGRLQAQGLNEREIRERVDSAAAAVLLQAWLENRSGE